MRRLNLLVVAVLVSPVLGQPQPSTPGTPAPPTPILRDALVLEPTSRGVRAPINPDAIQLQFVTGTWQRPAEGGVVTLHDGKTKAWAKISAGEDGWIRSGVAMGGSVFASVHSDTDRVALLHAQGHGMVYVNDEPRAGDPYRAGYHRLPVALHKGDNDFLFLGVRGGVYAALSEPRGPVTIDTSDATLPDLVVGEAADTWAGVIIVNASGKAAVGLSASTTVFDGQPTVTPLPRIEACSIRKVPVRLRAPAQAKPAPGKLRLRLLSGSTELDSVAFDIGARDAIDTLKRTFISEIDGSVQYYAVKPAQPAPDAKEKPALVLSLHGASVEAAGQAGSYFPKTWAHVVCPTNRRPYGFDWEDWGRLDALEVLAEAQRTLAHDPSRVYLTGHSMGGHGSWSLACLRPDLFAATGPSAGWISFQSYSGAPMPESPSAVEELLFRSASASQTLAMVRNLSPLGVYILHGEADDNVPVAQARQMKEELAKFHANVAYYEQPGAGHWWGAGDEPGTACVDWAPMFDFFARHRLPPNAEVRDVDFTTVNPGVSSTMRWLTIEAQAKPLAPSTATLRCDPGLRRFSGKTENIARLSLDVAHLPPGSPLMIDLDGTRLNGVPWPNDAQIHLVREKEAWALGGPTPPGMKNPARCGPFKEVFRHRAVLVYPTGGTAQENAWGFAKARYDAETFAYRGNGSFDVVPDTAFDPKADSDRNVVLYGNADCNRAWKGLLGDSPVQVGRGSLQVGDKNSTGDDVGCLFIRPRPGSETALVGVIGGTGLPGMRVVERLPIFLSGVGFPDCLVLTPAIFTGGSSAVRAAGFFGNDWSIGTGEFAWGN